MIIAEPSTVNAVSGGRVVDIPIGTNVTTTIGKTLKITCPAQGGGPQTIYEWTVNGQHLLYDIRIKLKNGNELIITDLQYFDDGEYSCRAYTQYGYDVMTSRVRIIGMLYCILFKKNIVQFVFSQIVLGKFYHLPWKLHEAKLKIFITGNFILHTGYWIFLFHAFFTLTPKFDVYG